MSSCEFCDKNNKQENLRGSDGIFFNEKDLTYYLYAEYFRNEIYKIEVEYCPICGTHLSITKNNVSQ